MQSIILYPGIYVHPPRVERYLNLPGGVRLRRSVVSQPDRAVVETRPSGRPQSVERRQRRLARVCPPPGRTRRRGRRHASACGTRTGEDLVSGHRGRVPAAGRQRTAAEVTLLDHYGATNRAEFFAVATECFFEQPHAMQRQHEELYAVLRDFYLQDPAEWLPDAAVDPSNRRPAGGGGRRRGGCRRAAVRRCRRAVHAGRDLPGRRPLRLGREGRFASDRTRSDRRRGVSVSCRGAGQAGRLCGGLARLQSGDRLDDSDVDVYRTRGAAYRRTATI